MCGRFTLKTPMRDVAEAFGLDPEVLQRELFPRRYNIAPTQGVAVVRQAADGGRQLSMLHWGLIPSWADDPAIGGRMINARSETAAERPAFREALARRRCIVVADGFFEWKQGTRPKQPFYIRREDEQPFGFAGLWEHWRRGELEIESCTILTTAANELLQPLHDRMPVILDPHDYAVWLDEVSDARRLEPLLVPCPAEELTLYPVKPVVNRPQHDTPECLERPTEKRQGTLFD